MKLIKIFLVNEYEELSDLNTFYRRSIPFTSLDEAENFRTRMRRCNSDDNGNLKYEIETEFLYQDHKTALKEEGL